LTTIGPALLAAIFVMVGVHELAHLVAARAAGVACRFGLGHRLWILVAETDMTGVWLVPRRARFLPFLAGPLADVVGASLALLLLFACRREWCSLPDGALTLVRAIFVAYVFALLWQCYFFVRTDFYYVFSNLLRCRNLMADTEAYLRGLLARVSSRFRPFPLGELPAHERLAVRLYAPVWLLGRGLAFGLLFFVQLPLLWSYLGAGLQAWHSPTWALSSPASVLMALVMVSVPLAGLGLWMRSLNQSWRSR
jgi:hypothetical protein